jgi:hypothetical protein
MKNKIKRKKILYWTPRILSILFILFLSIFSLDIFDLDLGFWGTIVGLFIHLIPSFILTILLVVAWKYELVGGIAFILSGILYIVRLLINPQLEWYMLSWSLIIAGPAFIVGILWILNWKNKKNLKKKKK